MDAHHLKRNSLTVTRGMNPSHLAARASTTTALHGFAEAADSNFRLLSCRSECDTCVALQVSGSGGRRYWHAAGVIGRYEKTVIDCPDPRALAKFYCQVPECESTRTSTAGSSSAQSLVFASWLSSWSPNGPAALA